MLFRSFVVLVLATACASPAKEDAKGQVDESAPPSTPLELGKADASSKVVAVNVQSAHPYTNNLNKTYTVPFTALPSCATDARLHFKVLRTEAGYDYVDVPATGESFDGIADDTWTEWFSLSSTTAGRVRRPSGSQRSGRAGSSSPRRSAANAVTPSSSGSQNRITR